MEDESPIVWSQSGSVRSDVGQSVLMVIVGLIGMMVIPASGTRGLGLIVGLLMMALVVVWGLKSAFGRSEELPRRFLVYRDHMIAEFAEGRAPAVFSFSNVSKFEMVSDSQYSQAMSAMPNAVQITPVKGPAQTLIVYRRPTEFVAILNDSLEQYRETLTGDRRRP